MIEHIWTMPCRICTIDRDTNNVSLIEILEQIQVQKLSPTKGAAGVGLAQLEIVTLWGRSDPEVPTSGKARTSLISPTGEMAFSFPYDVDLTNHKRTRQRGKMLGFPATTPGRYVFRVESQVAEDEWQTVAEIPIWVEVQDAEHEPKHAEVESAAE